MAAKWPHLWRLPLHSGQEIGMRRQARMVDNCRHYALAATGALGCRPLNNEKQTMLVRSCERLITSPHQDQVAERRARWSG